ncbi:phenylalanine--tRNA ligase subunit beta [bacterium CG2_30_33_46]|nr:MAG: phenylalanine--tRNA ligase subunit beta [bacterium CG2_30_33_46]
MKVSINWLKEFIDFKIPTEQLAERINLSVVEVDEIINFNNSLKGVVVGEIKEIKKHPNADKLSIAKVSIGKKVIQIIFGTLKLKVGDKLPVAVAPVILPTGLEVSKTQIRGIDSEGMIASNKELGLFEYTKSDVNFLNKEIKPGTPIAKALGIDDMVLNLDVLSNRPDLFSHYGVAREIGAILDKDINWPKIDLKEHEGKKINNLLEVEIKDKHLCSRYQARVITDVHVSESPAWLKNRLIVLGVRPINNIVDITNYVMLEMGQPLHAFDHNKLAGTQKKKIIIRKAHAGEEIITLDDKQRKLNKETLVIADQKEPVAIAGVMGGKDTEVEEKTKSIILESANFNWVSIRKTSRSLGLRTEAVIRFEKGLDPKLTEDAIERASQLIAEVAKGKVVSGRIDENYSKESLKKISLDLNRLDKLLGYKVSKDKIKNIFSHLGIEVGSNNKVMEVNVPYYRKDLKEDVDLIEEVARISGYDKIPVTDLSGNISIPSQNEYDLIGDKLRNLLKGLGVIEVYNYTFVGESLLRIFGQNKENHYKLKNPLKPEHIYLRQSLLFSMIEAASFNARNFSEFNIFEISDVFKQGTNKFPNEEKKLSILNYLKDNSFLKLKGILENLFLSLNIENLIFKPSKNQENYWHPQRTADMFVDGVFIGRMGEIHLEIANKFEFKNRISVVEIRIKDMLLKKKEKIFKSFSRFPKIILDIAIVVDEKILEANIRKEIINSAKGLIIDVELFDVYRGSQVEPGKKSLAYHITYQSNERTLTDEEAESIQSKIIGHLLKKFKAKIRG